MDPGEVTILLRRIGNQEPGAWDDLVPVVYEELRALARSRFRQSPSDTLSSTALVHETFFKLCQAESITLNDRRHFFAVAAVAMRRVLVDYARKQATRKRGGGAQKVSIDDLQIGMPDPMEEILFVDSALAQLRAQSPRAAEVTELRYFAGLSVEETAEVLDVDPRTVKRDWRKARAILYSLYRQRVSLPDGL
ncbi:MAG: ECF-type sigma factor [Candidatus Eisenbacteria bacterium]